MHVESLHVYPVKSTAATDLSTVAVHPFGLDGDRRWLVTDPSGEQITARQHPMMLAAKATLTDDGIVLTGDDMPRLSVPTPSAETPVRATVWGTTFPVADAGEAAAEWFSRRIGVPARLVYQFDPMSRPITKPSARPGEVVSAADAFPVLVASTASLDRLNEWVAARRVEEGEPDDGPLSMRRFRPNIVVSGAEPFAEAVWNRVRIGGLSFRMTIECKRCVLTTTDPDTYRRGSEPLRSLARHRYRDGGVWFAVNMVPMEFGDIRVGDRVVVESMR